MKCFIKNINKLREIFLFYKQYAKRHLFHLTLSVLAIVVLWGIASVYYHSVKTNDKKNISIQIDDLTLRNNLEFQKKETSDDMAPLSQKEIKKSNIEDTYIEKLQEEDINIEVKRLEAIEKVPVHKWQNDLLINMKNEDIKQTIKNIGNFDEAHLADTSISDAPLNTNASYKNKYVIRLMRVRKLYAIGQKNPELIVPELRLLHKESLNKWPEALKKQSEDYGRNINPSEPDTFDKFSDYCLVATYLLSEFNYYDFLPLLSEQYKINNPPTFPSPVPPAITFYAMHRLASSYPRDSLSKEAVKLLDDYIKSANEFVPPPKPIKVTVWEASYSESDPRLTILGLEDEILQGQEFLTMPLYPVKFKFEDSYGIQDEYGDINIEKMNLLSNQLSEEEKSELVNKYKASMMQVPTGYSYKKLDELFNMLDAFVQIVYPPDKNQVP